MNDDNAKHYWLETAQRAARVGGQLAVSRLGNPGYRKWKGPRELVAEAALEIQERIVEVIRRDYPDHHFLLEEGEPPQAAQADPLWIIDPLDGSLNFFHGIPFFAVSIAFRSEGVYQLGVVYEPCRDELFHAITGQGAYLNDQPIVVDKFAEGHEAFDAAMVGSDWSGSMDEVKRALQLTRFVAPQVLHIRVLGAPSLGLCYIAAGRLHAYFGLEHIQLWDVAAGAVILQSAGGILTDIGGGPWFFATEGYLATNGLIHGSMSRALLPMLELHRQRKSMEGES
jgi:myo-inositol-1(or 4)-monophosphatase